MTKGLPDVDGLDSAIDAAVGYLFLAQRPDGIWTDALPSSPAATACAIVGLHFHSVQSHSLEIDAGTAWLRKAQNPDGSWGDALGTAGNLQATALAMGALGIIDAERSADALRRGMTFIQVRGGISVLKNRKRVPLSPLCLVYWTLAGFCHESDQPRIPLELALLPLRLRQRMSFTLPGGFAMGLMQAKVHRRPFARRLVDGLATPAALAYLKRLHEFHGDAGGFEESPLLVGVVLSALARAGVGAPIADQCSRYLLETRRKDGAWAVNRDLEFTASAAIVMGLQEAGHAADVRLAPTLYRMLSAQRGEHFPATGARPGGWSWAMPSGWPDVADTASALTILPGWRQPVASPHIQRAARWLLDLQRRDGSWGLFTKHGTVGLDGPCPILTARAVIALHEGARMTASHPRMQRAITYLTVTQNADGSYETPWYREHTMATSAVLTALSQLGLASTPAAQRARAWLLSRQLDNGAWGDGQGSPASVEETSWALYGLLASGLPALSRQARAAVAWLVGSQSPDGSWAATMVGIYFLKLTFSSDHLANGYALRALAGFRQRAREAS